MTIQEFGRRLLETNDLDPVYVALYKQEWPEALMHRWLVAYWCFYSCGAASWIAEQEDYAGALMRAAENDLPTPIGTTWPRGRERRHFRGAQGIRAVEYLIKSYEGQPELMVQALIQEAPDYKLISQLVQLHMGFGPWMAFKICDMVDRVLQVHVDFSEAAVFMFKDPVQAALMYYEQKHQVPAPLAGSKAAVHEVVEELIETFNEYAAPPAYDRLVNLQEIETILCKWKSHMHGHYPVGTDTREIREAVSLWVPVSPCAEQFLSALPEEAV